MFNRIDDVMVSVLTSSSVDRGCEPRWGQTKEIKIGICCFSDEHAALSRKSKDWFAQNQDNVSDCGSCLSANCCCIELVLQMYKNPTKCVGLVQSRPHHHLIEN